MANRWFISKDARIALIGASATVVAALVVGGFGLVNKGSGKTPTSPSIVTRTVTRPVSSSPSSVGQDSQTPAPQDSGGNAQYLSDMSPVKTDPDTGFEPGSTKTGPATVKGTTYNNSLLFTTPIDCSEVVEIDYAISRHYRRLKTGVGITDRSKGTSPVTFYVVADTKTVKTIYSVEVTKPKNIDISVAGVSRIGLVAKEQDSCNGDVSGAWMDARLFP